MSTSIFANYTALINAGQVKPDPAQAMAAQKLSDLAIAIEDFEKKRNRPFGGFFSKAIVAPKGLYIWGDVGRGKTMLMDLFIDGVAISQKRRVHFHEFMNEVHEDIALFRAQNSGTKGARDPIPHVAKKITNAVRLLCFDEFFVSDITDAMLLKRLFEVLFADGVVVVATSNIPPERLYWNGLNRQLFTPFIGLLENHVEVFNLDSAIDYRREKLNAQDVYKFGADEQVRAAMDEVFAHLVSGVRTEPAEIESLGRKIVVPAQAMGIARFEFSQLCEAPLGSRDYLKIAKSYHTLVVDGVPEFSKLRSDAAKRFILLIDTLYDRGVKLVASFAVPLERLAQDDKTKFEFARCLSRLEEMRSAEYIEQPLRQDIKVK